jgi:hypothetical protein
LKVIIILIICFSFIFAKLPEYAKVMITNYKLDYELMENWSAAESQHCKYSHNAARFGRYGIGRDMLIDYCRWTGRDFKKITNIQVYLKNDYNNCQIAYFTCRLFLDMGFNYAEFFQVWLWGLWNVYLGRWSEKYHELIFNQLSFQPIFHKKLYKRIMGKSFYDKNE